MGAEPVEPELSSAILKAEIMVMERESELLAEKQKLASADKKNAYRVKQGIQQMEAAIAGWQNQIMSWRKRQPACKFFPIFHPHAHPPRLLRGVGDFERSGKMLETPRSF